jgi:hypothetical protein
LFINDYVSIILARKKYINISQSLSLKNINISKRIKLILLLNFVVFTLGTVANAYFAIIATGYIATMLMIYFLGTKIKDFIINVGYIWISKWTVFIIFLALTGIYLPDAFLNSLLMFIVFNITINPSDFIKEKGTQ